MTECHKAPIQSKAFLFISFSKHLLFMFINHFVFKYVAYSWHYIYKPLTPIVRHNMYIHQHGVLHIDLVHKWTQQSTIAISLCAPFVSLNYSCSFSYSPSFLIETWNFHKAILPLYDDNTLVVAYSRKCTKLEENFHKYRMLNEQNDVLFVLIYLKNLRKKFLIIYKNFFLCLILTLMIF